MSLRTLRAASDQRLIGSTHSCNVSAVLAPIAPPAVVSSVNEIIQDRLDQKYAQEQEQAQLRKKQALLMQKQTLLKQA